MIEYGYAADIIENINLMITSSQNAYINKEIMKLIRLINRRNRNNEPFTDEIIQKFISLVKQFNPEEKSEKIPLSEVIQIFC
jgi:hypothetical protein